MTGWPPPARPAAVARASALHPDQEDAIVQINDSLGTALGRDVEVTATAGGYRAHLTFDSLEEALDPRTASCAPVAPDALVSPDAPTAAVATGPSAAIVASTWSVAAARARRGRPASIAADDRAMLVFPLDRAWHRRPAAAPPSYARWRSSS